MSDTEIFYIGGDGNHATSDIDTDKRRKCVIDLLRSVEDDGIEDDGIGLVRVKGKATETKP